MRDKFAVLGYGSLIWDLEILTPHVELPWLMGEGPALPLEFSRVSPKRKMGLVVVLDADEGAPCVTHAIASRKNDIHAVAEDLRERERATHIDQIGAICLESGFERSHYPDVAGRVRDWCSTVGARGAVWTDLTENFAAHTGEKFTHDAALRYLQTLQGESLAEAIRYIDNAPERTVTPLRTFLESDGWWCSLSRDS